MTLGFPFTIFDISALIDIDKMFRFLWIFISIFLILLQAVLGKLGGSLLR
jgi:hypothetical protein